MGNEQSYGAGQYSELPLSGLSPENGLYVIYTPDNRYIRPNETVLTIKQKYRSWTGDDSIVNDLNGIKWFDITVPMWTFPATRTLTDPFGQEIGQYQVRSITVHAAAHITVQTSTGRWCVATVRKTPRGFGVGNADIFIHNPMQPVENLASTDGIQPNIQVHGNFRTKDSSFMKVMGIINGNQLQLCKIAQLERDSNHPNTYCLRIGTNVDVAFICMCAYALDELFPESRPTRSLLNPHNKCYRHDRINCHMPLCNGSSARCYRHGKKNCIHVHCK